MTGILLGVVCFVIALALLISLLHDLILWSYKEGYAKGRSESEKWWVEQEKSVVTEREKIWREEAR